MLQFAMGVKTASRCYEMVKGVVNGDVTVITDMEKFGDG
jgi:hypothetical protein